MSILSYLGIFVGVLVALTGIYIGYMATQLDRRAEEEATVAWAFCFVYTIAGTCIALLAVGLRVAL